MTGEDHIAFYGVLLATDGISDANLVARAGLDLEGEGGAARRPRLARRALAPLPRLHEGRELERAGREVLDEQVKRIEDAGGTVLETYLRKGPAAEERLG